MESKKYNRAIIIANGNISNTALLYKRLKEGFGSGGNDIIISADGGAFNTLEMGLMPDVVIGDMDSIKQAVKEKIGGRSQKTRFITASPGKDESDTHLAVSYAVGLGLEKVIIAGATGGRMDHTLANIMLLASPELKNIDARILTDDSEIFVIEDSCTIKGEAGKLVSIFSLSPYTYFYKTSGLKYKLEDEKLFFSPVRGLSNIFTGETARINIKEGQLLIIKQI